MLSKVLFLWNSTCRLSCLIVLWCWSTGPVFSVPPAFWRLLGFCCIASKPSAVVSKPNRSQSRSRCRMQLQRRSRGSCFPCSLCTLFSKFLPNWLADLEIVVELSMCNFGLYPFGHRKSCRSWMFPPGAFSWNMVQALRSSSSRPVPWCLPCKASTRLNIVSISWLSRRV